VTRPWEPPPGLPETPKFCTLCFAANPVDSVFCRRCGAPAARLVDDPDKLPRKIEPQAATGGRACEKCGKPNAEDANFCPYCGAPIEKTQAAVRVCAECGEELEPDARFCGGCGRKAD